MAVLSMARIGMYLVHDNVEGNERIKLLRLASRVLKHVQRWRAQCKWSFIYFVQCIIRREKSTNCSATSNGLVVLNPVPLELIPFFVDGRFPLN